MFRLIRRTSLLYPLLYCVISTAVLLTLWTGYDGIRQPPHSEKGTKQAGRNQGQRDVSGKVQEGIPRYDVSHDVRGKVLEGIPRYDRMKDLAWSHRDNKWVRTAGGNKHPLTGDIGDHQNGVVDIEALELEELTNRSQNANPVPPQADRLVPSKTQLLQRADSWPTPDRVDYNLPMDPDKSWFCIHEPGRSYRVGDTVKVKIQAVNIEGQKKSFGGDFWRAKIQTLENRTSAVGTVEDHGNGTYTASLRLLWPGEVTVSIMLVHPSEAVSVLRRLRSDSPLLLRFRSKFRAGDEEQEVKCNLKMDQPADNICDYSNQQHGIWWFCEKPANMTCADRVSHVFLPRNFPNVTAEEGRLLEENGPFYKKTIKANPEGPDKIVVHDIERNDVEACMETRQLPRVLCAAQIPGRPPCRPGTPLQTPPAGFYLQDVYISTMCENQQYSPEEWMKCLAGKTVQILGDSTARQLFYYLNANLPVQDLTPKHVPPKFGPLHVRHQEKNVSIKFNFHSHPVRTFSWVNVTDIVDEVDLIDRLPGGRDTVLVLSIWSHFAQTYLSMYADRMLAVRAAVLRLLARSPRTLVVIKSANTRWNPVITTSDWYGYQLDQIQREVFRDVPVAWLDAWDMTSAGDHQDNIHPAKPVVLQEIQMLMSYICQMQ
ncbi:PREDICTED: NXPE family member 3-like [Branchiostoma belcheri]|uniref:NXPE family member 3-like n=1 Tax=Branchiostoma belcheri TaxID=7741 RepID=A0A6P4ZK79_BRABE|nr:PREDICTED: NXPE family member 3-like [Branchiostoma belcheri]